MSGFIEGENRYQSTLFPERVDDYVEEHSVPTCHRSLNKDPLTVELLQKAYGGHRRWASIYPF